MSKHPHFASRLALTLCLAGALPSAAHAASTVETFASYSPVTRSLPYSFLGVSNGITYTSPSWAAYQANTVAALMAGATAGGAIGTPGRFQALNKTVFTMYETTATPFHSWLGNTAPTGAFAGEYGTVVRDAVKVVSDVNFTLADVLYRYSDDEFGTFGSSLRGLGARFGTGLVGRDANGNLITTSTGTAAGDAAIQLRELYFAGIDIASTDGIENSPEQWAASGKTPRDYWDFINAKYGPAQGGDYEFSNTWSLRVGGVTLASDVFSGSIVAVPEPGTWALLILGFGVIGGAMRQRGRRSPALA